MAAESRHLRELPEAKSMHLLASTSFGRLVFSQHALPAIRLVNHIVDNGTVIIRTHLAGTVLAPAGTVVAYEADVIDPHTHLGWSVIVTGLAEWVTDARDVVRYEQMLRTWGDGDMDQAIRIRPHLVTGLEFVGDGGD
ncbi:pyridoxamine 5'-phosphate oxidase family protein [Lentzea aerocolonigenes]|uniref:pyridoxamine 5'-phosphate oxidase family protein n=1 Tax=Lentzea aerocolonigenes TaxID=68170 RepID=UPI0004C36415|nr:pyridoxamine 5'-phosphate oxidase family protein [Lentzea aerocolonigenes]MCP2243554.1 Pyridoxamine 5'-phosphate oxidase [Lentzea aerocolonigenes]